jgi:predicted Zn-dependent peptidase
MNRSFELIKKITILTLSFFLLGVNFQASSQEKKLSFPITQFELKNGLHVILVEDYSLPLVSIVVGYDVGSINEPPGKTGLAYLLQNMMFQGSENVGRMQHVRLIDKVGGILNATTTEDKTIFFQTVPSNQLARILWLEADRMNSLDINPLDIEQVKEALIEENRHQKETNSYFESLLAFDKLLYPDPAFSHPIIGYENDIRNLTVEDIKNFYQTFYTTNNAVLAIAGNIDKRKTEIEIRKYFETIPRGKDISLPESKPLEKKAVVKTFEDSMVSSPGFYLGYAIASPLSDDFYPLTILEYILLRGKTSRLYKRLIERERIAFSLSGGIEKRKNLARFKIFIINNNWMMAEICQKALFSEFNKIRIDPISEEELLKSKNLFKMDYLRQFETSLSKALSLAEIFLEKRRVDDPWDELEKYLAVSPYIIMRAAKRYFTEDSIILNVKIK